MKRTKKRTLPGYPVGLFVIDPSIRCSEKSPWYCVGTARVAHESNQNPKLWYSLALTDILGPAFIGKPGTYSFQKSGCLWGDSAECFASVWLEKRPLFFFLLGRVLLPCCKSRKNKQTTLWGRRDATVNATVASESLSNKCLRPCLTE